MLNLFSEKRFQANLLQMKDESQDVRLSAAKALLEMHDSRTIEPFLDALNDTCTQVVITSINALVDLNASQTVNAIIPMLDSSVFEIRMAAVRALGTFRNPRTIHALLNAIADPHPYVRKTAATFLNGCSELVKGDKNDFTRIAQSGQPWAFDIIAKGVENGAAEAFPGLACFREPRTTDLLVRSLGHRDANIRIASLDVLAKMADCRAIPALVKALSLPNWLPGVRVIEILAAIQNPMAVSAIIDQLKSTCPEMRYAVAKALGTIEDPRIIDALPQLLDDPYTVVVEAAIHSLETLGIHPWGASTENFVPRIIDILVHFLVLTSDESRQYPSEESRNMAVNALQHILKNCKPEILATIVQMQQQCKDLRYLAYLSLVLLSDSEMINTEWAINVLNEFIQTDSGALDVLAAILCDPDFTQSYKVFIILGVNHVLSRSAINRLLRARCDDEKQIRTNAFHCLNELDRRKDHDGYSFCSVINDMHEKLVERLLHEIHDQPLEISLPAQKMLTTMIRANRLSSLFDKMRRNNPHALDTILSKLEIGFFSETHDIMQRCWSRQAEVRCEAARTLGNGVGLQAFRILLPLLSDSNAEVCSVAKYALQTLMKNLGEGTVMPLLLEHLASLPSAGRDLVKVLGDNADIVLHHSAEYYKTFPGIALGDARSVLLWVLEKTPITCVNRIMPWYCYVSHPNVVPMLIRRLKEALQNEMSLAIHAAIDTLAKIGDPSAMPIIVEAVSYRGYDATNVRTAAVKALGLLGNAQCIPAILAYLVGQSSFYRQQSIALEALTSLGEPQWQDIFEGDNEAVFLHLQTLDDPRIVDALLTALSDEAAFNHVVIARTLGNLGETRACETLLRMQKESKHPDEREAAADALAKLGVAP